MNAFLRPARRLALLFALVLFGAWAALFGRAFLSGETFVERDLFIFHRPLKALTLRLALEGQGLPLWNPYLGSGQPFAANPQHALFHPLTWLLFVLPFETAFRLQVALPPLAAAAAMFLLQRARRRSGVAAGLSGLSFGLGGYLLSATHLLPTLFAASVLPAVAAAAIRLWRRPTGRAAAAMAAACALLMVAGEPTTLLVAPLVVAAALAEALVTTRGARRRRAALAVVPLGLALALGTGLAAAALLPAARLAARSARAEGLSEESAGIWSMPAQRLAELCVPPAFGLRRDRSGWPALYPERGEPFLYSLYPGLLVAPLAAFGVALSVRRRRRGLALCGWIACAALGALLALGTHAPFWPVLRAVPPLAWVRFPEKFVLLTVLALVVLAGDGCDRLRASARARRALRPIGRAPWLWLIVALDLACCGRGLLRFASPAEIDRAPAAVVTLRTGFSGPVYNSAGWTRATGETLALNLLRPPLTTRWGLATTLEPDFDLTELRWSREATASLRELQREDPEAGLLAARRRGVRAILRLRDDVRVRDGVLVAPPSADSLLDVVFLDRPRPFAFCAARVERIAGAGGWMAAVRRLGPAAAETVLADAGEPGEWPAAPAAGKVTLRERRPSRIVLEVETASGGACVLAVNQTWDEFWRASVDGEATRLARVDLALSALVVPSGRRRVELVYSDPLLNAGLAVSGLAGLATLALALRARGPSR